MCIANTHFASSFCIPMRYIIGYISISIWIFFLVKISFLLVWIKIKKSPETSAAAYHISTVVHKCTHIAHDRPPEKFKSYNIFPQKDKREEEGKMHKYQEGSDIKELSTCLRNWTSVSNLLTQIFMVFFQ